VSETEPSRAVGFGVNESATAFGAKVKVTILAFAGIATEVGNSAADED